MFFLAPAFSVPSISPRRPTDAEFSAMSAQEYPTILDRETGAPWYIVRLAERDREIEALKKTIAILRNGDGTLAIPRRKG